MEKNYCFEEDTKVKLLQAFEKALFASKSDLKGRQVALEIKKGEN